MRVESFTDTFDGLFVRRSCNYVGIDTSNLDPLGQTEFVYSLQVSVQNEPIETHPRFRSFAGTPLHPRKGAVFIDQATGYPIVPKIYISPDSSDDGAGMQLRGATLRGAVMYPSDDDETPEEPEKKVGPVVGVFDKFVGNSLSGVTSYLAPSNTVWRESWTSITPPAEYTSIVGQIATPRGPYPNYGGQFNWLYVGLSYEIRGSWTEEEQRNGSSKMKLKHIFSCSRDWRLSGPRGWHPSLYRY
jgi:hypothetical protein